MLTVPRLATGDPKQAALPTVDSSPEVYLRSADMIQPPFPWSPPGDKRERNARRECRNTRSDVAKSDVRDAKREHSKSLEIIDKKISQCHAVAFQAMKEGVVQRKLALINRVVDGLEARRAEITAEMMALLECGVAKPKESAGVIAEGAEEQDEEEEEEQVTMTVAQNEGDGAHPPHA